MTSFIEKYFAIIVLNALFLLLVFLKDDVTKATEGVKAVAWYVSAPVCEVNNFCHNIESDKDGGTFISDNLFWDSFWYGKFTKIKTSSGDYVVQGDVKNHQAGSLVTLKAKENQLCIDTTCYQVANNKK